MINPTSITHQLNPFPWYATMRASQPVAFDPARQSWNVFRYEDVLRVLSDYTNFSSQLRRGPAQAATPDQPLATSLINTDPPRHRQLRTLVTQAFTPRSVEALAPRITTIVHELLDTVASTGRMDIIHDLGYPLPVIVIAELLGVPSADRERFKHWSDAIVATPPPGSPGNNAHGTAQREMGTYFVQMIEQRRNSPGDDLISALLKAQIEGEHLSVQELLGFCALLLVAGNETTTNLIGNALLCFTDHPGSWEQLRADRTLLPAAIEEVLRYRSPVQSMFRVAAQDTLIGDQQIPAGSFMVSWIGSGNHDEAQFPEPETFKLDRQPNRHLAFGQGVHFCLGAPLARLEARIALDLLLDRFESIERVPDTVLVPLPSSIVYGVESLPVTFEAA
ncbi:MAG: cytochrome P450 [Herpetosiphonaceae bacterium]|nr:cytochrome P450 [Herpetosiphonaceae bacterium]